jgi:AcrR family transcriptional regulator
MLSTAEARPKRLRDARAQMYTELIIEAATAVFAREGYDATKVQEIAKESGISLGTLYEVFPGKVEIWRAIHERHLDAIFKAALSEMARAGAPDFIDHLMGGLDAYLGYLVTHPDYLRLHLMDGSAWALGTGLRSNVQVEAWERGKRLMTELLGRGVTEGYLVREDPELLAQILIGMHQVRLAHWVQGGMKTSPSEVVARIEEHTVRAFFVPSAVKKATALLAKRTPLAFSAANGAAEHVTAAAPRAPKRSAKTTAKPRRKTRGRS